MPNAMIFHGTGESSESFWYPYVEEWLESKEYDVWVPDIPDFDNPKLTMHLPFVLENGRFTENTILIGHSAGCPLVLAVLEEIDVKVSKVILVSGFIEPLDLGFDEILKDEYDWDRIRNNFEDIFIINSDNDPWNCDMRQGKLLFGRLGGTLIVREGEGHMGSNKFNQPYEEFPFLLKLLE